MRRCLLFVVAIVFVAMPAEARAQRAKKEQEAAFVKSTPTLGELLPAATVHWPDGKTLSTADFRGHFTVLTFGCLT